ncbi:acyltransferase [Magnetofaba australis]|uniref:Putative acetyltransferase n=1 Tax=Magnetofaba australis IT-1 TaxID=1434232 RepID=A0A1Y2K2D9_9PROT|nr:acyltransferase [Magnetofaba australis]OSM02119.1 putative acetyltransferase [Magnetofaba australis IT-1]
MSDEFTTVSKEEGTIRLNNVRVGPDVAYFSFVNLYGCTIGAGSKIGAFVEIQKNAVVGKRCKISSHSFLCEGVTLGDDVFVGHGVMFTNDRYPRASSPTGQPLQDGEWKLETIEVGDGAGIGSNVTILPGVKIGKGALVGAGAVVTRDVPDGAVVQGVPARVVADKAPDLP